MITVGAGDKMFWGRLAARRPVRLFDYAPYTGRLGPDYDLSADGARLLVIRPAADTPGSRAQLVLIQNWIREVIETFDQHR